MEKIEKEYYHLLGVSKQAGPEEIRSAYFKAVRHLHPDANPINKTSEQFLIVQEAYETLSDPKKRADYDEILDYTLKTNGVNLNVVFSRAQLPALSEPQLVYAYLEISCTKKTPSTKTPLHLCLVLDTSTSMQGERLDMVKTNVTRLLHQLRPQDYVSIVAFNDRASIIIPLTPFNELSLLENRIYMLDASGGTEIYSGLDAGINQLRTHSNQEGNQQIILLTDGNTYGDEQACLELARQSAAQGITINSLGMGHEWNDDFLDQLAGLSGGSTMFVRSSKDLEQYMENKIKSVRSIYSEGINLVLKNQKFSELRYAFRLKPEALPLPPDEILNLGNLEYNRSLSIILEFYIPEIKKGTQQVTLSSGDLILEIPRKGGKFIRYPLSFVIPISNKSISEPPPDIIRESLSKLALYRLQERARREVAAGQIELATRHLQYLATQLLSIGDHQLAQSVLGEADNIQHKNEFTNEGEKHIKYATRGLFLPSGLEQEPIC